MSRDSLELVKLPVLKSSKINQNWNNLPNQSHRNMHQIKYWLNGNPNDWRHNNIFPELQITKFFITITNWNVLNLNNKRQHE